jgi:hypothetical protein
MKNPLKLLLVASLILVLPGCANVAGNWHTDKIEPASAKANFDFCCLTLNQDNTFTGCANVGGQMKQMTGKYEYDASHGLIRFTTDDEKTREYKVAVCPLLGQMKVTGGPKDQQWTAVMKRMNKLCAMKECGHRCEPAKCPHMKSQQGASKASQTTRPPTCAPKQKT